MSNAVLIAHRGARIVTRDDIIRASQLTPDPTETWVPVSHIDVLETVEAMLSDSGFGIASAQFALHGIEKMFATFQLKSQITHGVSLAVGVRNSVNKTFPMGFCAGNRVFVCDNLSFSSELLVARKHTKNGAERYQEAISHAVKALSGFQEQERKRLELMQETDMCQYEDSAWLLKAFEHDILSVRSLPVAMAAIKNPPHDWGDKSKLYHAWNAITYAIQPRAKSNPQAFSLATQKLLSLLFPNPSLNFEDTDLGYIEV